MQKLNLMILLLLAVVLSANAIELNDKGRNPEYVNSILGRSKKIVDKLGLQDTNSVREVTYIIANRYFELNDIYEVRDSLVKIAKETLKGDEKQISIKVAENEKDSKLYRSHFAFPAALSLFLDEEQIAAVKDGIMSRVASYVTFTTL